MPTLIMEEIIIVEMKVMNTKLKEAINHYILRMPNDLYELYILRSNFRRSLTFLNTVNYVSLASSIRTYDYYIFLHYIDL